MHVQSDLSGGIFCNGLKFILGATGDAPDVYDLVSIAVRVLPVRQLYNMATVNAWDDDWGN